MGKNAVQSLLAASWSQWLTEQGFLDNAPWQWLALAGVMLGGLVAGKIVAFCLERQSRRLKKDGRFDVPAMLLHCTEKPISLLIFAGALYLAGQLMALGGLADFWNQACTTVAVLAATWFIFRLVDLIEHYLHRWTSKTETLLDDQLVPLVRKTLRVFVVIVALLFIAQNVFEWDVGALIAGLGIGGLAIALAARDMLANLFGSVMIFADRPFQMGDRIRVSDHEGIVEEVGFRSTRIRTLVGHQVTVPNAVLANTPIENIGRRPHIKRALHVTVTYDTPPQKVQRAVDIIREMLEARHEHFDPDKPPKVFFNDFNAESLNIVVYYWFTPPDWWAYLEFTHEFNMELLSRFNAESIEFAFPTQTLYLKGDQAAGNHPSK